MRVRTNVKEGTDERITEKLRFPTFKIAEPETWDCAVREIGSSINPTRINKPSDNMHRNVWWTHYLSGPRDGWSAHHSHFYGDTRDIYDELLRKRHIVMNHDIAWETKIWQSSQSRSMNFNKKTSREESLRIPSMKIYS